MAPLLFWSHSSVSHNACQIQIPLKIQGRDVKGPVPFRNVLWFWRIKQLVVRASLTCFKDGTGDLGVVLQPCGKWDMGTSGRECFWCLYSM
ncbi:hypothetical protein Dimus_015416 [Dionaea muscipula]